MSHELRTPLNAILGFSRILYRTHNLTADLKNGLQTINRSGEYLLTLINDILDMSKIEAGRMVLNEVDFDLHQLLKDVVELSSVRAKSKDLTIALQRGSTVPQYLHTDEIKLRQVLINLISNAVKFTTMGGITLEVSYEAPDALSTSDSEPQKHTLRFKVIDTGQGIAPEELDKIFEAFVQTRTGIKSLEGTGLGLSICQKFIHLMGGEIAVESTLGQGSTFFFHICVPLGQEAALEEDEHLRQVIGLEPQAAHRSSRPQDYKILIVDDIQTNRQVLFNLLNPIGFSLQEATNGQEALVLWKSWQPHLIFTDMRMPVMDGYTAVKQIRASETKADLPRTPIIAVTASAFHEETRDVLDVGCDEFLSKPFKESSLFEILQTFLQIRFIYQTVHTSPEKGSLDALTTLPDAMQAQLKQAIEHVDIATLTQLVESIHQQNPSLARTLQAHLDDFEYTTILDALP